MIFRLAPARPERDEFAESVAEFMQRNRLKIDLPLFRPSRFTSVPSSGQGALGSGAGGGGGSSGSHGVHAGSGGHEGGTLQTPVTEFLSKELRTPEVMVLFCFHVGFSAFDISTTVL